MYTELSRVFKWCPRVIAGGLEGESPLPTEMLETVWRFCRTVSRLSLGYFFEPAKKNLFKDWYISNVRETGFSKLSQCVNTWINLLTMSSQNTQNLFSSFLRFIPLSNQSVPDCWPRGPIFLPKCLFYMSDLI
jgi:hypothetical protein